MNATTSPSLPIKAESGVQVLVVEDDPLTLELMYEVLSSPEVEVFPTSDSRRAAGIVNEKKFDGIFVDVQMPGIDGLTLTRKIRQSSWNRATPVIVVTDQSDKSIMERAFAAGGTFFLQKPDDKRKMLTLLNVTRGAMLANRRRYRRVPLEIDVTVQALTGSKKGRSINISEQGMLLEPGIPVETGSVLHLAFCVPEQEQSMHVTASVKRIDQQGRAGVFFSQIHPEDQQSIKSYIDAVIA